jgi:hypothetical protein
MSFYRGTASHPWHDLSPGAEAPDVSAWWRARRPAGAISVSQILLPAAPPPPPHPAPGPRCLPQRPAKAPRPRPHRSLPLPSPTRDPLPRRCATP